MQIVDVFGPIGTVEATPANGRSGVFKRRCFWRHLRHWIQMPPLKRPGERMPCGSKTLFRRLAISSSVPAGGQILRVFFSSRGQRSIIGIAPDAIQRSINSREQPSNAGYDLELAGG